MNTDQIKGKMQNAFGKAEQSVGEAVGSHDLANAGAEDRLKGAAKETWGNAKDTVHEMHKTAKTHADVAIKDSINTKMDEMKAREQDKREDLRRTA